MCTIKAGDKPMFESFRRKIIYAVNGIEIIGNGGYRKTGLHESIHGHHQMKNMSNMIRVEYMPESVICNIGEARRPSVDPSSKGGMIVFSTDVNATKESGFVGRIKSFLQSVYNKMTVSSRVKNTVLKTASGFSLGNFFRGVYKSDDGKQYDETSLSVEVIGVESKTLELLATDIAKEFNQETVLVKDYSKDEIYFADRNDVEPTKMNTILPSNRQSPQKDFTHA